MESSTWDGRLGLVLMTDIAVYPDGTSRHLGGAGAIALLIAPNASIVMEPVRSTSLDDIFDSAKPMIQADYSSFDFHHYEQSYFSAVERCYKLLKEKYLRSFKTRISIDSFDSIVFHSQYCSLVQRAFQRLCFFDMYFKVTKKRRFKS